MSVPPHIPQAGKVYIATIGYMALITNPNGKVFQTLKRKSLLLCQWMIMSDDVNVAGNELNIPPQKGFSVFARNTARVMMNPANIARAIFCEAEYF